MGETVRPRDAEGAMLSIGALARATGLAVETIRTWERRYGFPAPVRKPSGHRVYPAASVQRLRRVAEALAQGHRAGEVLRCSEADLGTLLGVATSPPLRLLSAAPAAAIDVPAFLAMVKRFDGESVTRALSAEWGRLGPVAFLDERVGPLVRAVGDAWESGEIEIRHEHFFSERLCDLLRAFRIPYEERARGPLVVLGTLPGEAHAVGLQMAALVTAFAGCRVCYVGTEVPVAELVSVARDLGARAVAVSVSVATRGSRSTGLLTKLRAALPARVDVVVGGEGAPTKRPGVRRLTTLGELSHWTAETARAA
jgi:methanogenic corrinoid protein MtbC1